jgi:hypothetical protein
LYVHVKELSGRDAVEAAQERSSHRQESGMPLFRGAECLKNFKSKILRQISLLRGFGFLGNISPGFCREKAAEAKFASMAAKPLWQGI